MSHQTNGCSSCGRGRSFGSHSAASWRLQSHCYYGSGLLLDSCYYCCSDLIQDYSHCWFDSGLILGFVDWKRAMKIGCSSCCAKAAVGACRAGRNLKQNSVECTWLDKASFDRLHVHSHWLAGLSAHYCYLPVGKRPGCCYWWRSWRVLAVPVRWAVCSRLMKCSSVRERPLWNCCLWVRVPPKSTGMLGVYSRSGSRGSGESDRFVFCFAKFLFED